MKRVLCLGLSQMLLLSSCAKKPEKTATNDDLTCIACETRECRAEESEKNVSGFLGIRMMQKQRKMPPGTANLFDSDGKLVLVIHSNEETAVTLVEGYRFILDPAPKVAPEK